MNQGRRRMTPLNKAHRKRQQRWLYFTGATMAAAFAVLVAALAAGHQHLQLAFSAAAVLALCMVLAGTQIARLLASQARFEHELAESEVRHRTIVEDQREMVSLARPDGTIEFANRAYARQFQLEPEQLVGRNLYDFIEPQDREEVRQQIEDVLTSGETRLGENRMLAPDGSTPWIEWTDSAQIDPNGRLMLHSVGRDISARKKAEDALRESEDFLRRTGRVGGVGGWQVDLASGTMRWSGEVRRIHDVDADYEPSIEKAVAFYAPEARHLIREAVDAAKTQGRPFDVELPLTTAAGRPIYVRAVGETEFDEQGQPLRLVGALQDVTERRKLEDRLRESERFVREITDNVPVALAFVDRQGRYQFINRPHLDRFGLPREAIIGRTRAELSETPLEGVQDLLAAVLSGVPQRFTTTERIGGRERLIDGQLAPAYDEHGAIKGFYATGIDITDFKRNEMRLHELTDALLLQTTTLNAIIEAMPALVAVFDKDQRYRLVNREFERQRQMQREDVIGRGVADLMGQAEYDARQPWVQKVLAGETVSFERNGLHAGALRHVSVTYIPLRLDNGSVDGFISIAQDITSHREEERRLLNLSEHDALTGVLNRGGFISYLSRCLESPGYEGLALLYIDLDRFKPVNDTYGHVTGDAVLQQLADRLKGLVRPTDAVARLGGDEFAIVLPGVHDAAVAESLAGKVVGAAREPFHVDGITLHIGASVGIALATPQDRDIKTLMVRADEKVYAAKAAGRGRLAI